MAKQIRPGSIRGSVVSLIAASLGAGSITLPYLMSINGLILGSFLIMLGAALSYYSGILLVFKSLVN
jgi:amino acid permease